MKAKVLVMSVLLAICGSIAAQDAAIAPAELEFSERVHDFGSIQEENGKVTHVFEFTNVGNKPLTLTNVRASCGCTTPEWPKEPIAPKKSGYIKVTYNPSGRPGNFNKSITITYQVGGTTDTKQQVINIKGQVIPKPRPEAEEGAAL